MGNSYLFKYIPSLLLVLGIMLTNACNNDEDLIFDDSLQVLSQKIDGEAAVNGVDGIDRNPSIEIIFSHTLKTAEVTSALSLTGGGSNGSLHCSLQQYQLYAHPYARLAAGIRDHLYACAARRHLRRRQQFPQGKLLPDFYDRSFCTCQHQPGQ